MERRTEYRRRSDRINGYQSFFENSVFGLFRITPEGKFIIVNQAMVALWEYDSPQEMIDAVQDIGVQHFLFEKDYEKYQKIMAEKGMILSFEFQGIRKDKSIFWCRVSAGTISDENNDPLFYEGSACDITREKEAQISLEYSESLFRELLDTIPGPVFYKDVNGKYLGCNIAFEKFFGVTKEWLLGKTVYDLAPLEIADSYKESDNHLFNADGECVYEEFVHPIGTDEIKTVIVNKATFKQADGSMAGLVGVVTDISEIKKVNRALAESEKQYKRLADNMRDFILEVDKNGKITYASPSYTKRHGWAQEDLMGKVCFFNVFEEDVDMVIDVFNKIKNDPTKIPDIPEYRSYNKKGEIGWNHSYGVPYVDIDGNFDGGIIVSQDITCKIRERQKRIEAENAFKSLLVEADQRFEAIDKIAERQSLLFKSSMAEAVKTMREGRLNRAR